MTTPRPSPAANALMLAPFRGVRYAPEKVSGLAAVTSPPYDVVVHPDERRHLETADPHNVVRLILPHSADPAERHGLAADTMRQWQRDGVLTPDPEPALYVYEQRDDGTIQRGIIGILALDGPVLPHEDVMPTTVADRAGLMRATAANLEPLLLTYRSDADGGGDDIGGDDIDRGGPEDNTEARVGSHGGAALAVEQAVTGRPLLTTITEDGIRHSLWAITEPHTIRSVTEDLASHEALIADGHHRWATYQRLQREHGSPSPWDLGLVLLVDSARYPLRVRAIHRVLYRLPLSEALNSLGNSFRVRHLPGPRSAALEALARAAASGNAFLLTGREEDDYHLLTDPDPALLGAAMRTDRPEAWRTLDTAVLHDFLLRRVWNVPETPDHIAYLHDAAAAERKARRSGGTAVLMHPVEERVVRSLARRGVMMPGKSTSFGPKPASGLVLRDLRLG